MKVELLEGQVSPFEVAESLGRAVIVVDEPREVRAEQSWEVSMNACSVGKYDVGDWSSGNTPYVTGEWTLGGVALSDEDKWWLGEEDWRLGDAPYDKGNWTLGGVPCEEECDVRDWSSGNTLDVTGEWTLGGVALSDEDRWWLGEDRDNGEFRLAAEAEYAEWQLGEVMGKEEECENKNVEIVDEIEWERLVQEVERLKHLDQEIKKTKLGEVEEVLVEVARDEMFVDQIKPDQAAEFSQRNEEISPKIIDCQEDVIETVMLPVGIPLVSDAVPSVKSEAAVSGELPTRIQGKTRRYTHKSLTRCRVKMGGRAPKIRGVRRISRLWRNWIEKLVAWVHTPVNHMPHVLDLRLEDEVLAKANRRAVGDKV